MRLIIVESPKKARTLGSFAGTGYRVIATMGHVRDLPGKRLGVDVGNGFAPEYEVLDRAKRTLASIRGAARGAEFILLATDPDREGEAIAWHVAEALGLSPGRTARIVFHEISERALRQALATPRAIDQSLVDAQQARRVLDRLVGYGVSPLLWRAVARGTSGGRVQSVALRLIVDREREIQAFVTREFWTVDVELSVPGASEADHFLARVTGVDGVDPAFPDQATVDTIIDALSASTFRVLEVGSAETNRMSPPPFTTSTLQQVSGTRLRLSAKRTMQLAQDLYEDGLITYMRTDSVSVSPDAIAATRRVIEADYGSEYLPSSPRRFQTRTRNAQEAHEAIRPVDVARRPQTVRGLARGDAGRLYEVIWQRMVASQMAAARIRTDKASIEARRSGGSPALVMLEARASTLVFAGWLALYGAAAERGSAPAETLADGEVPAPVNSKMPVLARDQNLQAHAVHPAQHFTKPPPRYSEATLVRALEAAGVGRPSTYASIVSTIEERGYVGQASRVFVPTPLGCAVIDYLLERFPSIVDVAFTAQMEDQLDEIAEGKIGWQAMLAGFHGPFSSNIAEASRSAPSARPNRVGEAGRSGSVGDGREAVAETRTRRIRSSATSGGPEGAVTGATGDHGGVATRPARRTRAARTTGASPSPTPALGDTATPRRRSPARNARLAPTDAGSGQSDGAAAVPIVDPTAPTVCPKCGAPMVARTSSWGPFTACSGYPKCKYIHRADQDSDGPGGGPRRRTSSRQRQPDPMTARVVRGRRTPRRPRNTD